jgi:hypothetical protein
MGGDFDHRSRILCGEKQVPRHGFAAFRGCRRLGMTSQDNSRRRWEIKIPTPSASSGQALSPQETRRQGWGTPASYGGIKVVIGGGGVDSEQSGSKDAAG